jgi:hypothetical protein
MQSEPGKGTTVQIEIPIRSAMPPQDAEGDA